MDAILGIDTGASDERDHSDESKETNMFTNIKIYDYCLYFDLQKNLDRSLISFQCCPLYKKYS